MKNYKLLLLIILWTGANLGAQAQEDNLTENPRGVYKLTMQMDNEGNINYNLIDLYKILTDSISLMVTFNDANKFYISSQERPPFVYTGEEIDPQDTIATRIYNSNSKRFMEKWYRIPITPSDSYQGWITEEFEAGKYTESGVNLLKALMEPVTDSKNPLVGTWVFVGGGEKTKDWKKNLNKMREEFIKVMEDEIGMKLQLWRVFTPRHNIMILNGVYGTIDKISLNGKKASSTTPNILLHGLTRTVLSLISMKKENNVSKSSNAARTTLL